ncbi:MAG: oligosaccharide flippase family protein [Gammaproteobacteria bacterium]|jgi:O-antigen/teichoic acid export membrane protein
MRSVKRNIIANYLGSGWAALMGLVFIPFYIRLMGAEAYGIVGVFISLQAMFAVLDLGLSQTLNREMARLSVDRNNAPVMADTARTLELVYWGVALAIAAVILLSSNFIAMDWLNPEQLSGEILIEALYVIAVVIGLRWPVALYMGGLNGLQHQVSVNALQAFFATLQGAGAVSVLLLVEPTLRAYLYWQALVALLQVIAFRRAFWRHFQSGESGSFQKDALKRIWRFAAGIGGISILATILTQLDKIILSKLLPLSQFGYYVFAATVAGILYRLIGPVFTAYYPRLTELVSIDALAETKRTYHQGSQLMAAVLLPLAFTLVFFSREILELWAGDPEIVTNSYILVSVLVIGNTFNGLMHMPYALQLAHGWTRLAFYSNLVAVIVLAPAIFYATSVWGAVGAAGVWVVLNGGYLLFSVQFMHTRLLKTEKWRWYIYDLGIPLVTVLIVTGLGRVILSGDLEGYQSMAGLLVVLILATAATVSFSGTIRRDMVKLIK